MAVFKPCQVLALPSILAEPFIESAVQSFMLLANEINDKTEETVPDSEAALTFLKSRYILGGYMSSLWRVNL